MIVYYMLQRASFLEIQPMDGMVSCMIHADTNSSYLLKLSLPLTLLQLVVGCVIMPLFLQNIGGPSKMYMICTQVAVVLYLNCSLAALMITNHVREKILLDSSISIKTYFEKYNLFTIKKVVEILKMFFYYLHYAFTLLQCINYRKMICNPLHFADYIKRRNLCVRILVALVLAALAMSDDIADTVLLSWSRNIYIIHGHRKVLIYAMCEQSLFRVVFLVAMVKMAHDIRKSLRQGGRILDGPDRMPVFIAVAIVPIINGFLCHAVETCMMLVNFFFNNYESCDDISEAIKNHVTVPILTAVHLIASLASCCTYLICFPKLRENPCFMTICQRGQTG